MEFDLIQVFDYTEIHSESDKNLPVTPAQCFLYDPSNEITMSQSVICKPGYTKDVLDVNWIIQFYV